MSKITAAAKNKPCIRCGLGQDNGNVCSRHYNGDYQHLFGKGRGIKCHDLMSADLCDKCDLDFSEGDYKNWPNRSDRDAAFLKYICLTNIRRLQEGTLKT
jgi:hypothetical protein